MGQKDHMAGGGRAGGGIADSQMRQGSGARRARWQGTKG